MYRWTSHTGEEQLEIEAPTPAAVLTEAVDAFGRAIELEPGGEPARHEVRLSGRDPATLLVELLQELVFLADTEGFVPDGAELVLADGRLEGTLTGRRTQVRDLVKAATYGGLRFERSGGGWRARVVLDV